MNSHHRTLPAFLLATLALIASLTLTACSGSGDTGEVEAQRAECANPTMDLMETELATWATADPHIAVDQPKMWANWRIKANQFDPCAPLSWVVLEAVTEPVDAPYDPMAWESAVEYLLLFQGEHLVLSDRPVALAEVSEVTPQSDGTLTVDAKLSGPEYYSDWTPITLTYTDQGLSPESLAEHPELDQFWYLDFTVQAPPTESGIVPKGNAHYKPWDQEFPVGKQDVVVGVPVGASERRSDRVFPTGWLLHVQRPTWKH